MKQLPLRQLCQQSLSTRRPHACNSSALLSILGPVRKFGKCSQQAARSSSLTPTSDQAQPHATGWGRLASCRRAYSKCLAAASAAVSDKKRLVFLGTPDVAASVLRQLLKTSQAPDCRFELAAVVTQPGRRKGRGKKPTPSPVAAAAAELGLADSQVLTPEHAKDPEFLEHLKQLAPDLCVTAAYGNILPKAFLSIPARGTLNIHPSLLPRWRGAAPVPRSLEAGDAETGVSVAFTVRAMDAGPVLAQQRVTVDPDIQAPELLQQLFDMGTRLLIDNLDSVWAGEAAEKAVPQDESQITHAAKMSKEEAAMDLSRPAQKLHNQVRAFAGWPGTTATLFLEEGSGDRTPVDLKIIETRVSDAQPAADAEEVLCADGALHITCGPSDRPSVLKVLKVQLPGKKAMRVTDFLNGFVKGRKVYKSPT